jgi:hypothetical protein
MRHEILFFISSAVQPNVNGLLIDAKYGVNN